MARPPQLFKGTGATTTTSGSRIEVEANPHDRNPDLKTFKRNADMASCGAMKNADKISLRTSELRKSRRHQ